MHGANFNQGSENRRQRERRRGVNECAAPATRRHATATIDDDPEMPIASRPTPIASARSS
jgi:hypothetical protein